MIQLNCKKKFVKKSVLNIIVLYRNDKEIPNNISFFDLNGNLLYTMNDIVKAKIPIRNDWK